MSQNDEQIIRLPLRTPAKPYLLVCLTLCMLSSIIFIVEGNSTAIRLTASFIAIFFIFFGYIFIHGLNRRALLINNDQLGLDSGFSKNYSWVSAHDIVFVSTNQSRVRRTGQRWNTINMLTTKGGMRGFNAMGWKLTGLGQNGRKQFGQLENQYGKLYPFIIFRNLLSDESNSKLEDYLAGHVKAYIPSGDV